MLIHFILNIGWQVLNSQLLVESMTAGPVQTVLVDAGSN